MRKYTGLVPHSIFLKKKININHNSSKYHPYLVKQLFEKNEKKLKKKLKNNLIIK